MPSKRSRSPDVLAANGFLIGIDSSLKEANGRTVWHWLPCFQGWDTAWWFTSVRCPFLVRLLASRQMNSQIISVSNVPHAFQVAMWFTGLHWQLCLQYYGTSYLFPNSNYTLKYTYNAEALVQFSNFSFFLVLPIHRESSLCMVVQGHKKTMQDESSLWVVNT